MKTSNKILVYSLMTALITGCGAASMKEEASPTADYAEVMNKALADSTSYQAMKEQREAVSSSAAAVSKDTSRKFIRTADLKFKVKNVIKATYRIEDIVNHFN